MKTMIMAGIAVVAYCAMGEVQSELKPGDVTLRGYVGERLDGCIKNNLLATDVSYLTDWFRWRTERNWWHAEFWGKFMHGAVPLTEYSRNAALKAKVEAGVKAILAAQLPDGYIGNYADDLRDGAWSIWDGKYTLLGLLLYHEATGDAASLNAAKKLADYLYNHFGRGMSKEPLHRIGNYRGLPSCSLLEPIIWLYRSTKEPRYRDFADYIVEEMNVAAGQDGAELVDAALRGVDMADRPTGEPEHRRGGLKAYEMMSCYQGLLEYYELTGEKKYFEAALRSADNIARTEINIAGGSCTCEHWYSGRTNQTRDYRRTMETCVTTTWMRLCEKLFALTGDPRWAEEIEKSFYNAYLASLKPDGSVFSMYHPLSGFRHQGEPHCRTHTNCCNANGPRGFLAFLQTVFSSAKGVVCVNQYASGTYQVALDAAGGKVPFEVFSRYPQEHDAMIRFRGDRPVEFTLKLRIPSWCGEARLAVREQEKDFWYYSNACKPLKDAKPGEYHSVRRVWKPGDTVVVGFDHTVKAHEINDHVAFTRGPIVLCRDLRFHDGDIGEMIRRNFPKKGMLEKFELLDSENSGMWIVVGAPLPVGMHYDSPEYSPRSHYVRFCDYASAGGDWTPQSGYRTWFPLENLPGYMKVGDVN